MIVRDEAELLPGCLESVKDVVDEMIVVDTGSVDETPNIAEQYGARVIAHNWQDDFAIARNVSLEAARGEWILFLDADEQLDARARAALHWYTKQPNIEGVLLRIHSYIDECSRLDAIVTPVLRLFRNNPKYRFQSAIHEQILNSMLRQSRSISLYDSDLIIHHFGYLKRHMDRKDKIRRNRNLLLKQLEMTPDDPFHLYNLGSNVLQSNEWERAVGLFRRSCLSAPANTFYRPVSYKYEIAALLHLNRLKEALETSEAGIRDYPDYTDLHHWQGVLYMQMGNMGEAKASLERAARLGAATGYITETGIGTYRTRFLLAHLAERGRNYAEAIRWYMQALEEGPAYIPLIRGFALLMRCLRRESELVSLLVQTFHPDRNEVLAAIIPLLVETRCYDAALALMDLPGIQEYVDSYFLVKLRCYILSGKLKEAKAFADTLSAQPHETDARLETEVRRWLVWMEAGFSLQLLQYPFSGSDPAYEIAAANWLSFAAEAALANSHARTARSVVGRWQVALFREPKAAAPEIASRLVRTIVNMADDCLAQAEISSTQRRLLCESRLQLQSTIPRVATKGRADKLPEE